MSPTDIPLQLLVSLLERFEVVVTQMIQENSSVGRLFSVNVTFMLIGQKIGPTSQAILDALKSGGDPVMGALSRALEEIEVVTIRPTDVYRPIQSQQFTDDEGPAVVFYLEENT